MKGPVLLGNRCQCFGIQTITRRLDPAPRSSLVPLMALMPSGLAAL